MKYDNETDFQPKPWDFKDPTAERHYRKMTRSESDYPHSIIDSLWVCWAAIAFAVWAWA